MMTATMSRRAHELATEGTAFVTATVVHAQRPTSATPGDVALVLADGTIEGFVGGLCSEHSVRAYALQALATGEAVLLRILPFAEEAEAVGEEGTVTVQNPCLSGGAIEVFLEPVLPAPRVLVVGDTPIAGALLRLGAEVGFDAVHVDGSELRPRAGDLAVVVAAHGRDELLTLRLGLETGLPYVGLVASRKRGDGVLGELRSDGVPDSLLQRIDVPAGLDIGARTPSEIALSILARIIEVRRDERAAGRSMDVQAPEAETASPAAGLAVDPMCGMTVAAVETTPSVEHGGETVYFCCEGCKARFVAEHDRSGVGD
ncbi:MAG: xanthine dehydrogenase accessory factor [Gaiellales bacterium]|jgi:xanthine dehydrogenase accessory factor|nr:xanthine dehydrogenase accessory factor [Gaiellales bacterium]